MNKLIISLAPVSASDTHVDPDKVAEEVIASEKLGAAIVHLHVRDLKGKLTRDVTDFSRTIKAIRKTSNLIIQASTGGISNMTIKERCAPLEQCPGVEMASLNGGSVNLGEAVYANSLSDILFCAKMSIEKNIIPEFEVFELGMVANITQLEPSLTLSKPLLFNTIFGHRGTLAATIGALTSFRQFLPKDALWGVTHFGRRDFLFLAAAVGMGADLIRIGFEDSPFLDASTQAENNLQLVEKLAHIAQSMDRDIATPDEARHILNIKKTRAQI